MNLKTATLLVVITYTVYTLYSIWNFYKLLSVPMGIAISNYLEYIVYIVGNAAILLFFVTLYKNQK